MQIQSKKLGKKGIISPILYFVVVVLAGCCPFGRLIKYEATPAIIMMTITTAAAISVRLLLAEVVVLDVLVVLMLVTGGVEVVEAEEVDVEALDVLDTKDVGNVVVDVVEIACAKLSPQN
jgi:hypothetical protein